jgi:hypothetical protein
VIAAAGAAGPVLLVLVVARLVACLAPRVGTVTLCHLLAALLARWRSLTLSAFSRLGRVLLCPCACLRGFGVGHRLLCWFLGGRGLIVRKGTLWCRRVVGTALFSSRRSYGLLRGDL